MSELPEPLVPADVDLRGYEFMPLYGDRLFKSNSWKKASWEARCAMLRLWWHAFAHESPPASLPDDDMLLADYAGYGDAVAPWLKVRDQALRHWRKCSDGRFYDPVLAEIVMQAWGARVMATERGRAGAAKKWKGHKKKMPEHENKYAQASRNDAQAMQQPSGNDAQASATDSTSNACAIKKDGKGSERKVHQDLDLRSLEHGGGNGTGQNHGDNSTSTPSPRRTAVQVAEGAREKALSRKTA